MFSLVRAHGSKHISRAPAAWTRVYVYLYICMRAALGRGDTSWEKEEEEDEEVCSRSREEEEAGERGHEISLVVVAAAADSKIVLLLLSVLREKSAATAETFAARLSLWVYIGIRD